MLVGICGPSDALTPSAAVFALLERLLVEFLALSSSAPLVYWLGCLCSLVALLVVLLLVRLEVWFLQLVLRFSLRFSMV